MIRQFKLTNGEEIVCEVLEWNTLEDPTIVIRGAYLIVSVQDNAMGYRYYTFRSWMTLLEDPTQVITLHAHNVLAECEPADRILEQYERAVNPPTETISNTDEELSSAIEAHLEKMMEEVEAEARDPNTKLH